jgi:hypothetical protein
MLTAAGTCGHYRFDTMVVRSRVQYDTAAHRGAPDSNAIGIHLRVIGQPGDGMTDVCHLLEWKQLASRLTLALTKKSDSQSLV